MRRARSPILCALLLSGLTLTACGGGSYGPGYYHEPYGLYPYPYSAYGPYLAKPYGYGGSAFVGTHHSIYNGGPRGSSFGFGGVRRRW
jgi:hypothetical protein